MAKTQAPEQDYRDHHASPADRHIEACQQPVPEGAGQAQGTGAGQPGQAPRPEAESRQGGHQAIEHASEQGDVLAGDHHQVGGSGVLQQTPIPVLQSGSIPQHQCGEPSRPAMGVHLQQTLAQAVAPGGGAAGGLQQLAGLDRAAAADPSRQQPGLVVERRRIHQPARPLEPDRQAPALAGQQWRALAPGQSQACRQQCPCGLDVLQFKAHHTSG
ncbi:hypothetical protein FQZ97_815350 [compost metagenome]